MWLVQSDTARKGRRQLEPLQACRPFQQALCPVAWAPDGLGSAVAG